MDSLSDDDNLLNQNIDLLLEDVDGYVLILSDWTQWLGERWSAVDDSVDRFLEVSDFNGQFLDDLGVLNDLLIDDNLSFVGDISALEFSGQSDDSSLDNSDSSNDLGDLLLEDSDDLGLRFGQFSGDLDILDLWNSDVVDGALELVDSLDDDNNLLLDVNNLLIDNNLFINGDGIEFLGQFNDGLSVDINLLDVDVNSLLEYLDDILLDWSNSSRSNWESDSNDCSLDGVSLDNQLSNNSLESSDSSSDDNLLIDISGIFNLLLEIDNLDIDLFDSDVNLLDNLGESDDNLLEGWSQNGWFSEWFNWSDNWWVSSWKRTGDESDDSSASTSVLSLFVARLPQFLALSEESSISWGGQ